MSEVQLILKSSNGAFTSDLMADFLRLSTTGSVDSQGNLMAQTSSTGASTLNTVDNNQQIINNQQTQVDNMNQNGNTTTTTTSPPASNVADPNANTASNVADPNANTAVDPELTTVQAPVSSSCQSLITQATDSIVSAHLDTTINTYENVAVAEKKIAENVASGNMPDVSKMAGNSTAVWQKFVSSMVPEITKAVTFIKRLPGFMELSEADKMSIIKQSSFEVLLTRFCMLINVQTGDMIDPSLSMKFPRQALTNMPMGKLLLEFYRVAEKFNPLNLTDGENGLFASILVMNSEKDNLVNKSIISKIQGLYKQALYLQLKQNHTDADSIFTKLMATIPIFKEVNAKHTQALAQMKKETQPQFDSTFPPLHKEIYSQ